MFWESGAEEGAVGGRRGKGQEGVGGGRGGGGRENNRHRPYSEKSQESLY